jgi:hypothetical protein
MQTDEMILAEELCGYYRVEYSFIQQLQQFGLIELTTTESARYIPQNQLQKLEQMIRLHYELDINLEGIDAISHLLERIGNLQTEIASLRNRLKLYEEIDSPLKTQEKDGETLILIET